MKNIVFVYGSLKKSFKNSHILNLSEFLGKDFTKEPKWAMVDLGYFPGVVPGGNNCIDGELYVVDESTLINLDLLEGNGSFYNREQILVNNFPEPVWMYILINHYFTNSSESCRIETTITNNIKYQKWV